MEHGSLQGPLPPKVFSFPQIQQVLLSNNAFNGTLTMGDNISPQLEVVDLQNNQISSATLTAGYTNTLILVGNPVCTALSNTNYCQIQRQQSSKVYSTSLANCGTKLCTADQKLSPQSCECAYPYEGTLYFRGPSFRDLTDVNTFHALEMSLWVKLGLTPGSVSLQNPIFNLDDYLQVQLGLFPPTSAGKYFNRSEIQRIGFDLSNQTYKPPSEFGPYYFIASPYPFPGISSVSNTDKFCTETMMTDEFATKKCSRLSGMHGGASISRGVIAGIASGCAVLVLCLVGVAIYAVWQKKRAEKAIVFSKPFASWAAASRKDHSGGSGAPQLKGARWFSIDELKKCTSNFSGSNEIGSGGYGKVYRGMLSDGQLVAIKRARQGSLQGGQEFKTEIELLSRVHHKNLLALIGFCFEQGEQMLVYEFMPNGSLKESLTGKSGIHLDWRRRLRIALGSARGLAYLHELADPPIIHRDIKSTNILLDENLSAKVADFGLSKLVSDSTKGHVSTQVKGTMGYLDPEYYMSQQLTEKSDVYSFGVVVLELVTAKQPIEKGKYIVRQVRMKMIPEAEAEAEEEDQYYCGLKDMIDPAIVAEVSTAGTTLRRVLDLAMQCVEESAGDRPTMSQVVKTIEAILQEEGVNGNSTSASSSATDFGTHCLRGGGGALKHPYCGSGNVCGVTEHKRNKGGKVNGDEQCDAFDYSGGYGISTTVEPK
ncbi:Leucine-rich repeat receptor protein kinase HPCA1 [Linum grandiflorum]